MTDTRDLRDPQKLGEKLLAIAGEGDLQVRLVADRLPYNAVEEVSHNDSMGKQCVREYRAELEARAEEGDKYAKSALESIDAGKGVQGYDEAGS